MKFKKTKQFIDAINKSSNQGETIQIELHPKKYGFIEEVVRYGEWNGKFYEISGTCYMKRAEVEWAENLDTLLECLKGTEEITDLGNSFSGWELIGDDGGHPEASDNIKWFSNNSFSDEIKLTNEEFEEFEEFGIDELWDEAGFENEDGVEMMMDDGGMYMIIVVIGDNTYALISNEYFDQIDENGNWI